MKRLWRAVTGSLLLMSVSGVCTQAAPTIGATGATPTSINASTPTTITVTSVITDPTLITTGINLIRLNPGGASTILGQLHDDGLNGDAVAGDKTFTLQVTLNEVNAGQVQLQVSAAFRGVLQRVLSNVMTVTVTAASLPTIKAAVSPAPNAAGWNNSPVTVTFTCSDSASGIATCPSPVAVSMEGADQVITGTAKNNAGNTATASVTINLDETPPVITTTTSPAPNTAGWNKTNVTVSFACTDSLSGVVQCPAAVPVTSEGAQQTISGTVQDEAGNTATTTAFVNLDKTPPTVAITSPTAGGTLYTVGSNPVSGTDGDNLSGIASVTCNGAAAQVTDASFTCSANVSTGSNSITVQATDAAGNVASTAESVTVVPPPVVTITSPANLSYGNFSPITVQGTVDDPNAMVTINGATAAASGGTFSLSVPLVEGTNTLTAVATNAGGNQGSASIDVTLDTTPPHVTIDSPGSGTTTTSGTVTVTGIVNDVVVGTVNDQNATVTVNGIQAQVANRSYSAVNVPLSLGANTIQAVAVDRAGNATTTNITVTRVLGSQPPAPAIGQAVITQSLNIISGNNQSAVIGTQLATPLVVVLQDPMGNPVANQPVVFQVTADSGTLNTSASGTGSLSAAVNTNSAGQALVYWTLGQRAGTGTNTVQASSPLAIAAVNFAATALNGPAAQIVIDSGDDQTGAVGQPLTFPLVAVVTDSGHNRLPNVPVTFTVTSGGAALSNGMPSQVITSDSDGRVQAILTLGSQEGQNNNAVEATFPNNPGSAVAFTASGKQPGNPANTTISGVVLDNSNAPIPNVTIRLYKTNQASSNNLPEQIGTPVQTDMNGSFVIQNAPFGYFKLMADGSTATITGKTFPTLEYDIVTVAGQDNTVGTPIYLPALDTVNQLCVDATHGGTLTLPEAPGFALTVLAGSATFPGGSKQGCVSVSLVHGDKIPMAPGFGQQPRFIVTIQPVGTIFNPPAPITLPNVDGLPAREVTEMYSYDHDLSMFTAIGTGTVSDDGSVIVSDPGVGVLKAGWHCGGDPNATGHVADCGQCKICTGNACAADPSQNGNTCGTPQSQIFDLSFNGGADSVHVVLGQACVASTCMNGACSPPANGFNAQQLNDGLNLALNKIFDNSGDACIEMGLRQMIQSALKANGVLIDCKPNPADDPTDCAVQTTAVSNHLTLFSNTFTNPGCDGVASTILHELIHGPGRDNGAPDVNYHNSQGGSSPDCRDRPYGCSKSCFNTGLGNAFACLETPSDMSQALVNSNGCGPCKPTTFTYKDVNGLTQMETMTVCPSTY